MSKLARLTHQPSASGPGPSIDREVLQRLPIPVLSIESCLGAAAETAGNPELLWPCTVLSYPFTKKLYLQVRRVAEENGVDVSSQIVELEERAKQVSSLIDQVVEVILAQVMEF